MNKYKCPKCGKESDKEKKCPECNVQMKEKK